MTDLSKLPIGTHKLPSGCIVTVSGPSKLPGGSKRGADLGDTPWVRVRLWTAEKVILTCSLPSRELSPNGPKGKWRAKGKATREHREAAAAKARGVVQLIDVAPVGYSTPWQRATLQASFYWPDLRRRDELNAAATLKAYIDGIVDGGLLADDSTEHLRHLPATFDIDRKHPRVELTIERVTA